MVVRFLVADLAPRISVFLQTEVAPLKSVAAIRVVLPGPAGSEEAN